MGNLYTYIVTNDTGLAPNPYWGWCTLAVCTPNHQGSRIQPGDWVVGFLDKARNYRFLYAMEVAERIHMNRYFDDARFSAKKPRINGSWKGRCGDNFYSLQDNGLWKQHENAFHIGPLFKEKDTKHPWVFVSSKFWYLGKDAAEIPEQFKRLAGGRGARVNHPPDLSEHFRAWVKTSFDEGIAAEPNDREGCGRQKICVAGGDAKEGLRTVGSVATHRSC